MLHTLFCVSQVHSDSHVCCCFSLKMSSCKFRVLSLIHTCFCFVFTLTMSSCKMRVISPIHTCFFGVFFFFFFFLHWQCLPECESGVWRARCFHENLLGLCTAPRLRSSPSNTDTSSGISHWPSCSWRSAVSPVLLSVSPHLVWCLCTHPVTLCALSCVSVHFVSRVPCVVSVCALCLVYLVWCQCTLRVSCTLSRVSVHFVSCVLWRHCTLCVLCTLSGVCVHLCLVYLVWCLCTPVVSHLLLVYTWCLMYLVWCLCTPCVSCTSSCVSVHHVFFVPCPMSVCTHSVFVHLVLRLCAPCVSCTLPVVSMHTVSLYTLCLCTPCLLSVYTWCLVYLVLCLCTLRVCVHLSRTLFGVSVHSKCLCTPCLVSVYAWFLVPCLVFMYTLCLVYRVWCLYTYTPRVFVHVVLCPCAPCLVYLVRYVSVCTLCLVSCLVSLYTFSCVFYTRLILRSVPSLSWRPPSPPPLHTHTLQEPVWSQRH